MNSQNPKVAVIAGIGGFVVLYLKEIPPVFNSQKLPIYCKLFVIRVAGEMKIYERNKEIEAALDRSGCAFVKSR